MREALPPSGCFPDVCVRWRFCVLHPSLRDVFFHLTFTLHFFGFRKGSSPESFGVNLVRRNGKRDEWRGNKVRNRETTLVRFSSFMSHSLVVSRWSPQCRLRSLRSFRRFWYSQGQEKKAARDRSEGGGTKNVLKKGRCHCYYIPAGACGQERIGATIGRLEYSFNMRN